MTGSGVLGSVFEIFFGSDVVYRHTDSLDILLDKFHIGAKYTFRDLTEGYQNNHSTFDGGFSFNGVQNF